VVFILWSVMAPHLVTRGGVCGVCVCTHMCICILFLQEIDTMDTRNQILQQNLPLTILWPWRGHVSASLLSLLKYTLSSVIFPLTLAKILLWYGIIYKNIILLIKDSVFFGFRFWTEVALFFDYLQDHHPSQQGQGGLHGIYLRAFCTGLDSVLQPYRQALLDLEQEVRRR